MIMNRGKKLFRMLKPHLHDNDTILDYCCGVSQIAKYLVKKYNYIGFDHNEDIIKKMNAKFSKGVFELKTFVDIDYKNIDVLMFFRSSYMPYTIKYLKENIANIHPRVIFIDTCLRKRQADEDGKEWIYRKSNGLNEEYVRLNLYLIKLGYKPIQNSTDADYYYQIWRRDAH